MTNQLAPSVSRRALLGGAGALVVSFATSRDAFAQGAPAAPAGEVKAPPLPGSLKDFPLLDGWIRIDAGGAITIMTGKCELGQGAKTALLQIAAEQLAVDRPALTMITADPRSTPNEGFTSGSHTMQDSGTAILHAAAQTREKLVDIAAQKLSVPREGLRARAGAVVAPDGQTIAYRDLVAGLDLHVQAEPVSRLIDPVNYRIMGKPVPRVDIPAKVTGGIAFVQDMRMEGMVHARVVRPPGYGARLDSVETAAVEKMPGVLKVVRDGSYLAVIATREYQAVRAMRALQAAARWSESADLPPMQEVFARFKAAQPTDRVPTDRSGASAPAVAKFDFEYRRDFQMHASIGPSCALGLFKDDQLTVWSHAQGMFPLRAAIAQMLGMAPEKVACVHVEGSGCYGHNGADDAGADAAILARAFPGRPVRVQWMRDDEHVWEPKGSAMIVGASAALDAEGNVVDWNYQIWGNTHSTRPPGAGQLMPAWFLEKGFKQDPAKPTPLPEGDGDRNSQPLYTFPNAHVVYHFIPQMTLRVSAMRGLGAYMNVFAIESMMDELAAAAHLDPVAFRLRHLQDPRAKDVINRAAREFGWADGKARKPNTGHGFAFARYKNLGAYAAIAVELSVDPETGHVRLHRVETAVDSGGAVNPDGISNQIEGGIIQSASWTLVESVAFDRRRILARDWNTYPILRFQNMPESLRVHVIDRPGQPFLGTGEATQGPMAAAIANAIANATGVRLRHLPITPQRIREAVNAKAENNGKTGSPT